MFERPIEEKTGQAGRASWSVLAHVVVLTVILLPAFHRVRVRPSVPGSPQGTRIELSYLPGGASAAPIPARRKPAPAPRKSSVAAALPAPPAAPSVSAPSPGGASASANDALGTEDIQIALTTYSPSPKPDLSRMPHGTQGDIVIDITIDPTGKVADLQILQALGYGIEGAVADTVRTWTFQPAKKDGTPVASVQELHFHYGPV